MEKMYVKIADVFSKAPGPRYIDEGENSAELFLNTYFRQVFTEAVEKQKKVVVILDDTAGYATSFLEGTFGELARETSAKTVLKHLEIKSDERPYYAEEAYEYINDVLEEQKHEVSK